MDSIVLFLYYQRKSETKILNQHLRDTMDPFNISDRCFINNYRLPKHLVHFLIRDLQEFIDGSVESLSIPLHLEVLACLNFFASGSHQVRVGLDSLAIMSQSKFSKSLARISKIIGTKIVHQHIIFPATLAAANIEKYRFFNEYGVPGIIGLIDCTHIGIARIPKKDEYAYVNRTGFHSINVQMTCDQKIRITSINARYPGSTHDSHIWEGCKIVSVVQRLNCQDNKTWLFGDSGYALKPYMMVPCHMPTTSAQRSFNILHKKIRSGVERCFGVLKGRFRCLKISSGHLHYSHERAANIIYACAVLHNMLIENQYPIEEIDDIAEPEIPVSNAEESDNLGEESRQFLSNYIEEREPLS